MAFFDLHISFGIPLGLPLVTEPAHGTGVGTLGLENAGRLEVRAPGFSIKVLSYPYLHNACSKLGYFDIF